MMFLSVLSGAGLRFCLIGQLNAEHSAVVPLGLQLALANELAEGGVIGVLRPLGLLERGDIPMAQDRRDVLTAWPLFSAWQPLGWMGYFRAVSLCRMTTKEGHPIWTSFFVAEINGIEPLTN